MIILQSNPLTPCAEGRQHCYDPSGTSRSRKLVTISGGQIHPLRRISNVWDEYDVHLGRMKQSLLEDDSLLQGNTGGVSWPHGFYYTQQQILAEAAKKDNWEWVCILPEDVLGPAKRKIYERGYRYRPLLHMCVVCKDVPGSELPFPDTRTTILHSTPGHLPASIRRHSKKVRSSSVVSRLLHTRIQRV